MSISNKNEKTRILITGVGMTDPIRDYHDGPILHIIRYYKPTKIYMLLSKEVAQEEGKYNHNEAAAKLLMPSCDIEKIDTGIVDIHSYDELAQTFFKIGNKICLENKDCEVLLNVTSGTPQMETVLCMVALSNPANAKAIQVAAPGKSNNRGKEFFNPKKDDINEFFECDLDNGEDAENRCLEPILYNFLKPILQFRIETLIEQYNYKAALSLYQSYNVGFSDEVEQLLKHGSARLDIDNNARRYVKELNLEEELYPIKNARLQKIIEYYLTMKIKQLRREYNDFVLRLSVLSEQIATYIIECEYKIKIDDICTKTARDIYKLDKNKTINKLPGIDIYMDNAYGMSFNWGLPISGNNIIKILTFCLEQGKHTELKEDILEISRWIEDVSVNIRNKAAHTMVAISDEDIRHEYGDKGAKVLCNNIEKIIRHIGAKEIPEGAFDIYNRINEHIKYDMRK